MRTLSIAVAALATVLCAGSPAFAAGDAAKGKAKFESACADCHEKGDFKPADFGTKLNAIMAGQAKHKKALKLSEAEVADLVAAINAK
jgi:cytochrome c2